MRKKLIVLLLSCVVAGSLSACSVPFGSTTPESLIEGMYSNEMEKVDAEISLVVSSKVSQGDVSTEVSVSMDANLQSDGKVGYMGGKATVGAMGVSSDQSIETYYDYDDGTQYILNDGTWTYSEIDDGADMTASFKDIDVDKFDDLEMEKKDGGYVVTGKIGYDDIADMMAMSDSLDGLGVENSSLSDIDMNAEFTFGKDKKIGNVKFSIDPKEVKNLDLTEFSIEVSYNEIDKDFAVEIPKDIIKEAVKASDVSQSNQENTEESSNETPVSEPELEEVAEVEEPAEEENQSNNEKASSIGLNCLYNGSELSYDALVADGWVADGDTGIFVAFKNDKYPDVTLYAYGAYDEITEEDLKTSGIAGYDIDITYCDGTAYPEVSFGSLSWGASKEDITAVFGEPTGVDDYDDYTVLRYSAEDGSDIEFAVYNSNEFGISGLTRVSCVNYGGMQSR